jgi:creatinine amidohydrolase/Fe(II)-dependent formamide hydrolase-like protein
MIRLAERTYEEAAVLARDPKTVILFPLGAIEEHGPHLPLLMNWLGAEELAGVIAPYLRRAGWRPVLVGTNREDRYECSRDCTAHYVRASPRCA